MEVMKVSNIYNLNIYLVFTFMFKIKRVTVPAAFRNDFREISHHYPARFSQSNFVVGNILSNQTKLAVSSRGQRLWNRLLNQQQKNMAFINGFKSSLFLNLRKRNQGQKLRIIILYIAYYLTHTARGVTLSPADFFGKCEQIWNLLCIWSYLLKEIGGGDFISSAVYLEHQSELLLFGCFYFWPEQNKFSLVFHINFTCH